MNEVPYAMTIGGKRVFTDTTDAAISPAAEKTIGHFPMATGDHLDKALEAAEDAFKLWRQRPLQERQALVSRWATWSRSTGKHLTDY